MERLALVFAADEKTAKRKYHGSAYFMVKAYLASIIGEQVVFEPLATNDYPITSSYEMARSAMVNINGQVLGVIGEFRSEVKKELKLPDFCAGFELDLGLLLENIPQSKYEPIGNYPKINGDVTLSRSTASNFQDTLDFVRSKLDKAAEQHGYKYELRSRDIYMKPDSDDVNYTFRIWLWHPNKTLKTEELNNVLLQIEQNSTDINKTLKDSK
jgi:phenylalanyl-tRNA synthetase beta subunit